MEIIGYLRESKTEQNHLSPTGAGRVSKTENSKCWDGMCGGWNLVLQESGWELYHFCWWLPKSKTGWASLVCILPWVLSQYHLSQARWSVSAISALGR